MFEDVRGCKYGFQDPCLIYLDPLDINDNGLSSSTLSGVSEHSNFISAILYY